MTPKSLIEPARHAGTALLRSQSDARLVDLTRDGNERAFEAIVQRYRRPLLAYCARLLPLARAEDAVQQTFLSAHRAIHAGDAELNLRPWLYRIAHNSSLNLLRQNGFDHEEMSERIDGVETPPQAFERGERLRDVVAAVRDLPERQRSALVLQAVEGRSYDEIAAELGVTDGAVRQLLNRARTTLRDGATALTPTGLLARFAAGGDATVADRIAQAMAGAGGGALLAKAGAAIVVAGTVAGGVGAAGSGGGGSAPVERAATPAGTAVAAPIASGPLSGGRVRLVDRRDPAPSDSARRGTRTTSGHNDAAEDRPHEDRSPSHEDRSGSSEDHTVTEEDHSGSSRSAGQDDHSGSGSSGGGGGGSDDGDGGSSGSGSGSSGGGDSSGPGSGSDDSLESLNSGSGSSGSGDDDGSSGSGSGSSGSDDGAESLSSGSGSGSDDGH